MTKRSALAAVLAVTMLVSGCAWWQERSRTTKGAVIGTGAAIGAVVGGLSGTAIGYYMDRQKRDMEQVLERQDRVEIVSRADDSFTEGDEAAPPAAFEEEPR